MTRDGEHMVHGTGWNVTGYVRTGWDHRVFIEFTFEPADQKGVSTYPLPPEFACALARYLETSSAVGGCSSP